MIASDPQRMGDGSPGSGRLDGVRVLIYSHDSFGLGHLRRCRAIAHALVDRFKGLHVLIVCGSQIAGAFDFRARVDFVKVPSVIKLYNGEYTSISAHIDIAETIELRKALILCTAQSFKPDIMIVDKEPFGLHDELKPTLSFLKSHGCVLVLGLRDVMDAPHLLEAEWARKGMVPKIETFFDQLWVYGPADFHDPLEGLSIPQTIRGRVQWTGYLHRDLPSAAVSRAPKEAQPDRLLVTAGGGGDGADLFRQVVAAYAHDPTLDLPALLVLGPFMSTEDRDDIRRRAAALPALAILDFDNRMETLMDECAAVVSMGGYNTFCEILSLHKRALIVPRVHPRQEQFIRARRAAELGLVDMLHPVEAEDPAIMAAALKALIRGPDRETGYAADMSGLIRIGDLIYDAVKHCEQPELRLIAGGREP